MAGSLKDLISKWYLNALQEFLTNKPLKVEGLLSYFPAFEQIREELSLRLKDSVAIMSFGGKSSIPRRYNANELMYEFGEYQYFLFSTVKIPMDLTLFTVTEEKAEMYSDLLEEFSTVNSRIAVQGELPAVEQEYFYEYGTYVYRDPSKWSMFRVDNPVVDLIQHEGDMYEVVLTVDISIQKMIVRRSYGIDRVITNATISPSGVGSGGTILPSSSGSTSGSDVTALDYAIRFGIANPLP